MAYLVLSIERSVDLGRHGQYLGVQLPLHVEHVLLVVVCYEVYGQT